VIAEALKTIQYITYFIHSHQAYLRAIYTAYTHILRSRDTVYGRLIRRTQYIRFY